MARNVALARLPRPLALALSGGVSLGAMQVGMLRAVHEWGIAPDFIVGTSVGALNGAYVARGFDAERIDALGRIWMSLRTGDVFPGLRSGVFRVFGASAALALRDHVLASSAIPALFPPVEIGGRTFVDGGVAANVPLLQARRLGARTIIVLDAGYPCMLTRAPKGIGPRLLHVITLALRNQALGVLSLFGNEHAVLYLPARCPVGVALHNFSHAAELIDAGYQSAKAFLGNFDESGPGIFGHPHVHGNRVITPELRA